MEAVHHAAFDHADHSDRPAPRVARRRRRFEQDTPAAWTIVMPLAMAATVGIIFWVHALAHAH